MRGLEDKFRGGGKGIGHGAELTGDVGWIYGVEGVGIRQSAVQWSRQRGIRSISKPENVLGGRGVGFRSGRHEGGTGRGACRGDRKQIQTVKQRESANVGCINGSSCSA